MLRLEGLGRKVLSMKKTKSNKNTGRSQRGPKPARRRNQPASDSVNLGPLIKSAVASGLRGAGASLGGLLGPAGAMFGQQVGAGLSQIVGAGDYVVNENTVLKGDVPKFLNGGRRVRLAHAEFLGDVTSSTAFTIFTSYVINPGNSATFPWLSQIANNFQQYKFHGLMFEFKSTSAVALNSTNTALGTVILGTQYNVNDAAFTSKVQMENYEFSTSAPPSTSQMHPIECSMAESPYNVLWIRSEDGAQSLDPIYDHGLFSLATSGMQAAATIGELWVTYDVELLKPRIQPPRYSNILWTYVDTAYTNALPIGTTGVVVENDIDITVVSGTQIRLNKSIQSGMFIIHLTWVGLAGAVIVAPILTYSNATTYLLFQNGVASFRRAPADGETATMFHYTQAFTINGYNSAGTTITFSAAGTLPGTPSSLNVMVVKLA